jgi:hypothetical protein
MMLAHGNILAFCYQCWLTATFVYCAGMLPGGNIPLLEPDSGSDGQYPRTGVESGSLPLPQRDYGIDIVTAPRQILAAVQGTWRRRRL